MTGIDLPAGSLAGGVAPPPMSAPGSATERSAVRPEVEGLRGVAILLVVLYHAGLMGGGFVGVDVFFVISGFLITGLLIREREATGRISFAAFYARRARRLAPAGVVTLVATALAVWLLWPPLDRSQILADGAAATLSVANLRFGAAAGTYFAAEGAASPFLHFWSLSVEEQFYLVWPMLLVVATGIRWLGSPRRAAVSALAILVVGSFVLEATVLNDGSGGGWAFYLLPTRAWQLGVGGLLALAGSRAERLPWVARAVGGWAGMAAIAFAGLAFSERTVYPGTAALVPTLGSALVIAAATGRLGPGWVLATPPMRFLGAISYSLYLVHWPLFVGGALIAGAAGVPPLGIAAIIALSLALATLSWRFVEQPFRRSAVLARHNRRALAAALASLVVASSVLVSGAVAAEASIDALGAGAAASTDPWAGWSPPVATVQPSSEPTEGTVGPSAPPTPTPRPWSPPSIVEAPALPFPAPASWALPANVRPALGSARTDSERLVADGCLAQSRVVRPPSCVYGDSKGAFTVVLAGDSHASHWFPTLEAVARRHGWRLVTFVKVSCPIADVEIWNQIEQRDYPECTAWNARVLAQVNAMAPDLLLVSESRAFIPNDPALNTVAAKAAAYARQIARFTTARQVAMIADTGIWGSDWPSCLSAHRDDIRACQQSRALPFSTNLFKLERPVQKVTGIPIIDMSAAVCPPARYCQGVLGGYIVWRDDHHFTATFARAMAPAMEAAILELLGPAAVPAAGPTP